MTRRSRDEAATRPRRDRDEAATVLASDTSEATVLSGTERRATPNVSVAGKRIRATTAREHADRSERKP